MAEDPVPVDGPPSSLTVRFDGDTADLEVGYGLHLLLRRTDGAWLVAGLSMGGFVFDDAIPPGKLRDAIERAYKLELGELSPREAQVAQVLATELGDLPQSTAIDFEPTIRAPWCPNCDGPPSPFSWDRCFKCGSQRIEVHEMRARGVRAMQHIGWQDAAIGRLARALERDRQVTIQGSTYGDHKCNAEAVLTFAATRAGLDPMDGRLEITPTLARYFVDATEGVGAL